MRAPDRSLSRPWLRPSTRAALMALGTLGLAACGDGSAPAPADTFAPLGDDVYHPVAPPDAAVPEALAADRWVAHYQDDLRPYWVAPEALGTPEGNFPTFRGMDGRVLPQTERRPRMLSRQTWAYAAGYLLTGERRLLELSAAGASWLRDHAIDRDLGGCHELLTAAGAPAGSVRTAQDLSYCVMGLAGFYFVTRDPAAEQDLLLARDWLFDPAKYWDADAGQIRDALAADMSTPVDVEGDGGRELVAQLDPVNAFMLLVQPVLSTPAARASLLADLRTLGQVMVDDFLSDGLFWGVDTNHGKYGTKHVDWGHTLKSYWMLLQIDKRLPDHPFHAVVFPAVHDLLARAYDAENGRWSKRPKSATAVEYGSDWWIYAELDQIAATLDLIDRRYTDTLAQTAGHWLTDYVDRVYAAGEVIPGIKRDGSPAWTWPAADNAKCNAWKNGFHSAEHALVLGLLGDFRDDGEASLHFAVPPADADTFIARPYLFDGRELRREKGETFTVGGRELMAVKVTFGELY